MARRRFLPLVVIVALGALALIARLFQVQIIERDVWAAQAASLVRSGYVRPYERGKIRDARGRVLAHDQSTYRVEFRYRDFRRRHPLGLIAHARAALTGRPVTLSEALEHAREWADELVELTAEDFTAFGKGEGLELSGAAIESCSENRLDVEDRNGRRADARFYAMQLFAFDDEASKQFNRSMRESPSAPLIELAAAATGGSVDSVRERLHARLTSCTEDLDRLAVQLAQEDRSAVPSNGVRAPGAELEQFVARLETWREQVENDSASAMFRDAAGFAVGRVDPATLARSLDFEWLSALMRWDGERTSQWLLAAREQWLESLTKGQIEQLVTALEVAPLDDPMAARVLDAWADLFRAADESDTHPNRLAVLDQLDSLVDVDVDGERADAEVVLPFQDRAALAAGLDGDGDWRLLARAELGLDAPADAIEQLAEEWAHAFEKRFNATFLRERSAAVVAAWEARFQAAIALDLERRLAAARPSDDAPPQPLSISAARLDRASERSQYVLKDRGSRAVEVLHSPSYALVHLLTRNPDRFAGFSVDDAHERVHMLDGNGRPFAAALIGDVQAQSFRDQLIEKPVREMFDELRRIGSRTEEETEALKYYASVVGRPDELHGTGGIEGYFDAELAGRNGYREDRGLQDLIERRHELDVAPKDGVDIDLTLDVDLQNAALATLAHPDSDPHPELRDEEWLASPTGAIVMLTADGDVLAAASYPDESRGEAPRASRDTALERTLRKPTFQPAGSVFKSFVAAWALQHVAFDPMAKQRCEYQPILKYPGYADVRCNVATGHDDVDMRDAIKRSCNSYFAWLGEKLTTEDWRGLAHEFGFGEPTGIRPFGWRRGLTEDTFPSLFVKAPVDRFKRLAACGLSIVEATPMQVARATAALATGQLSDVRIVRAIGGKEVEQRSRPLTLAPEHLEFVRRAMDACANEAGGSAFDALQVSQVHMRVCAKTGSGDIDTLAVKTADNKLRVRKHAWLACWFPAEKPQYVLVVFVHDTIHTASHTAVWLARQFLLQPAVQTYLQEEAAKR